MRRISECRETGWWFARKQRVKSRPKFLRLRRTAGNKIAKIRATRCSYKLVKKTCLIFKVCFVGWSFIAAVDCFKFGAFSFFFQDVVSDERFALLRGTCDCLKWSMCVKKK